MKSKKPERTCVGCRKMMERDGLIRIVSSPEGILISDLSRKLPGRGAYVCCSSSCMQKAARRGGLSRALKKPVDSAELQGLERRVLDTLERRILSFLGLLMKGQKIVIGRESIRKAHGRGGLYLLIQAADGQNRARSSGMSGVPTRVALSRQSLGSCLGKTPQPAVGVIEQRGSKELLRLIDMKMSIEVGRG